MLLICLLPQERLPYLLYFGVAPKVLAFHFNSIHSKTLRVCTVLSSKFYIFDILNTRFFL